MSFLIERAERLANLFFGEKFIGTESKIAYITETLLPLAKSHIHAVEPKLSGKFFNDERVVQALKEAAQRGAEIEILHGPDADLPENELSRLKEEGLIKLFPLKEPPTGTVKPLPRKELPAEEFWVVDGTHILIRTKPALYSALNYAFFTAASYEEEFLRLKVATKEG